MDCCSRRKHYFKVPPVNGNIGCINSLQWLLNAVNRLLKVNCPIRVVIGRHYNINKSISSKISSIASTSKLHLDYLDGRMKQE